MKNLLFLLMILGLGLGSCQKDESNARSVNNPSNSEIEKIILSGFKKEEIHELKNYYLVQGCYMIPKENKFNDYNETEFKKYIEKLSKEKKAQYRSDHIVSPNVSKSIKIWIAGNMPTGGEDDWRNAVQLAINAYNNIDYVAYNLELTNNSAIANIKIRDDENELEDNQLAAAYYPTQGGATGSILFINFDALNNRTFSDEEKTYILCHELGHALGLRHSDLPNVANPNDYLIPNTPINDSNSIMQSGWNYRTWAGFSTHDITALRFLFPVPPEIVGPETICSEQTYTITNATSVFLENSNGIATLTFLGNNQWKVNRDGSSNGEVKLTSTNNANQITSKTLYIGSNPPNIHGNTTIYGGNDYYYTIKKSSNNSTINLLTNTSPNLPYSIIKVNESTIKITTNALGPNVYSYLINLKISENNICGTSPESSLNIRLRGGSGPIN